MDDQTTRSRERLHNSKDAPAYSNTRRREKRSGVRATREGSTRLDTIVLGFHDNLTTLLVADQVERPSKNGLTLPTAKCGGSAVLSLTRLKLRQVNGAYPQPWPYRGVLLANFQFFISAPELKVALSPEPRQDCQHALHGKS